MNSVTCFEAIDTLDSCLRNEISPEIKYFVLGGIATAVLCSRQTSYDINNKRIYATNEGDVSVTRENGTQRDIDIFICDVLNDERASAVRSVAERVVNGNLEVSIFSYDPYNPELSREEIAKKHAKEWTSKRTMDDEGTVRMELFPVQHALSEESLEPWSLVLPSGSVASVMHPGMHVLNYAVRSIGGLRPKDANKVHTATQNIMAIPGIEQEITTGAQRSMAEFMVIMDWMRSGSIGVGSSHLREEATAMDVFIARTKASLVHKLESHPKIVNFAQRGLMQKILNFGIGSR